MSSRESSCTSEESMAEQQYAEAQEQQMRETKFHNTNTEQSALIAAMRIDSNATLSTFTVPPNLPVSRTEAMKLLEQLQGMTANMAELGKAQISLASCFMRCLRTARVIRNRLTSIGVTRDTHGLAFLNQDKMIRHVASCGCNRALRIFERQSLSRSAPKAIQRVLKAAAPPARKPRAKKVVPKPEEVVIMTAEEALTL